MHDKSPKFFQGLVIAIILSLPIWIGLIVAIMFY
jgi:hypothetical protein